MNIAIEFYRIRDTDDVHAIVGHEVANAANLDDAISIARKLWQTLDMPQRPDAMTISDRKGNELFSGRFDPAGNISGNDTELRRYAVAIGTWENEGGAPASDVLDRQYGRRIEADRSWTVYDVFNGVPARIDGIMMTGLQHVEATKGMQSLNHRNGRRRK